MMQYFTVILRVHYQDNNLCLQIMWVCTNVYSLDLLHTERRPAVHKQAKINNSNSNNNKKEITMYKIIFNCCGAATLIYAVKLAKMDLDTP